MIKASKRNGYFGIERDGGTFIPLIYYKSDWEKLIRYVEKNHFFGKFRGYCLHKTLLDFMIGQVGKSTELVIIKRATHEKFISRLEQWESLGIPINYDGEQVCLPIKYMKIPEQKIKKQVVQLKSADTVKTSEEQLKMTTYNSSTATSQTTNNVDYSPHF